MCWTGPECFISNNVLRYPSKAVEGIVVQGGVPLIGFGGLVKADSKILWRGERGGMYDFDVDNSKFEKIAGDGGGCCGTLAVTGKNLMCVGGLYNNGKCSNEVMLWSKVEWATVIGMKNMPVACWKSCVVDVDSKYMLVIGGVGNLGRLNSVQIYNHETQTWHMGPPLPLPCWATSAVVHGGLVYVMGGLGMDRAVWSANITDLVTPPTHDKFESAWTELPDIPGIFSTICVINGVLLAIGGTEDRGGLMKTSAIYAFHQNWHQVGKMPIKCSLVDVIALSNEKLLIVDGDSAQVYEMILEDQQKLFLSPSLHNANNKDHIEKAVSIGKIPVITCLVLGAPGVGKTGLKHLLLKKKPPEAGNPVRAISQLQIGVSEHDEDEWIVVEDEWTLRRFVEEFLKNDGVSLPADINTTGVKDTNHQTKTKYTETKHGCGTKLIQYIDCGGQMQYHDILPLFIQNPHVAVFVINLSEELAHYPHSEHYGADGKPIGKPYKSSISHEQIIQQCLENVCSKDVRPLIIIVGTQNDTADKCSESIRQKDQKLLELLNSTKSNFLYKGESLANVIFPVNCKEPKDKDRDIAKILRHVIVSNATVQNILPTISLPRTSIELGFALRRLSGDAGLLTLAECEEQAKMLNMEGNAFQDSLNNLVKHNIVLYYPEVLPNIVFCDPQVVLAKVNEIVQYQHKLRDNPDENVAAYGYLLRFRDYGLVSMDLLNVLLSNCHNDLFTSCDLLKLLHSVKAISMFENGEYLMPTLLPHLDSDKIHLYLHKTTPLVIKPTQGCIPSGLFCCFVAHLVSLGHWKVCIEGQKPLCLYHNCITFVTNGTSEIVTIVNRSSYIQIHVKEPSMEVCKVIEECVHSCISNACKVLKYHDVQFLKAFMCEGSCCRSDPPHLADCVPSHDGKVLKWLCNTRQSQKGYLSEGQLMWMEGNVSTTHDSSMSVSLEHATCSSLPPTLEQLLHFTGKTETFNVAALVGTAYSKMGVFLLKDGNGTAVQALEKQHMRDAEKINMAIFSQWLQGNGAQPVAWSTLIGVLRKIGLCVLADDIKGGL